jgi:crotonobetainyl-CoA:carnitine CoA-transferase CaiB-like acyl-CoA transferase
VIYTPLPLCSVYAGVDGAVAVGAALADRERCGRGREITASRLAGGLSALGVLALTSKGIPDHLAPSRIRGVRDGMTPGKFKAIAAEASRDATKQLWLEQRRRPLAAPYRTSDDRLALPLAAPNWRNTRRICQTLGIWDEMREAGLADVSPYDPANIEYIGRNAADSMALNFTLRSKLADLLEVAFAKKTADEWEKELCESGIPCVKVMSWEEWRGDPEARAAGIWVEVDGHAHPQLGRASWVASAQPYPDLEALRSADSVSERATPLPSSNGSKPAKRPLEGFTVVDFCNVVAGPSCGRMFSELGATVYKIDPMDPQHSPIIMTTWAGEAGVGKRSIILDMKTDEGKAIMNKIVAKADIVVANKLDAQLERMGLDRKSLDRLSPSVIGLQLGAHSGEKRGARHDYPGYDPSLQGTTGIMTRFGPEGCPTYHGIASCVDYLCGYLGAWAGVTALAARERRKDGRGDWAATSLAAAASLTQLLLQQTPEPESARGAHATGLNEGERVYQLSDGWIFAQGDHDLSGELTSYSVEQALAYLGEKSVPAVPVQTCRELADRHRENPSRTVNFEKRERDGWENECFAPTWFAFDGEPLERPRASARIGADGPAILEQLGYSGEDVRRLISEGVVGQAEWAPIGR